MGESVMSIFTRLRARRSARRALPYWGGAALLVASVLFYLLAVIPAEQRVANLRHASALAASRSGDDDPARLERFQQRFKRTESQTDWLAQLHAALQRAALHPAHAEYRYTEAVNGRVTEIRVTLPLKGSYRQIRDFLADVLATMPVAALDHISIRRGHIGDAMVEAEARVVLFVWRS